jgi:hypothetical protein
MSLFSPHFDMKMRRLRPASAPALLQMHAVVILLSWRSRRRVFFLFWLFFSSDLEQIV